MVLGMHCMLTCDKKVKVSPTLASRASESTAWNNSAYLCFGGLTVSIRSMSSEVDCISLVSRDLAYLCDPST